MHGRFGRTGGYGSVEPWANVAHAWCHWPAPERARVRETELPRNGVPDRRRSRLVAVALLGCSLTSALLAVLV